MNSDWPTITALNLPSGGPAYPLSTPGIRLKYEPNKQTRFCSRCSTAIPPGPDPKTRKSRTATG